MTYSSNGHTVYWNIPSHQWYVEEDATRTVKHVGSGGYLAGYNDCVTWLQWFSNQTGLFN